MIVYEGVSKRMCTNLWFGSKTKNVQKGLFVSCKHPSWHILFELYSFGSSAGFMLLLQLLLQQERQRVSLLC